MVLTSDALISFDFFQTSFTLLFTLVSHFHRQPTKLTDLNPKAISPEELYGFVSLQTREWKDGVLSKTMRELGLEDPSEDKWIMLDGDLDANWIESMNSVMDDNKMLTLAR